MATVKKKMDVVVTAEGTETAKKKLGGVEKSIGSMAKGALAGVASFYALKKAIDFTVAASIKQEQIFRKLQTSVELTGKSWGSAKSELDTLFSSLQATTEYGDTESAAVFTTLMQLTSDYDKSVRALPMALDLASTGLFDTGTAAKYIAMAFEGNVEMLGRYIPELRAANNDIVKTGTVAEKSAEFMRIFNEKFTGTAQKNLESTAAQYKQLKNYLGDIGEAIGDEVLPAINSLLSEITGLMKIPLSKKTADERMEFNALVGILTNVNTLQDTRNRVIKILQAEYSDYIGNINLESAGYEELAKMQELANKAFLKKIQLEAAKETIFKMAQKTEKINYNIFLAEMALNRAREDSVRINMEMGRSTLYWVSGMNAAESIIVSHTKNIADMKSRLSEAEKKEQDYAKSLEERGLILTDLSGKTKPIIGDNENIIGQNDKLIEQMRTIGEETTKNIEFQGFLAEQYLKLQETEIATLIGTIQKTDELIGSTLGLKDIISDLGAGYQAGQKYASQFTGFVSSAILQMAGSNKNAFAQIEAAFKNMLTRMAAEFLAKSFIFGLASLLPGGFGVGLTGGKTFAKFVFGAQHGADFVTNRPTMIMAGEGGVSEHVKIQPAPITNNNLGGNLTVNMYGTYYQDIDHLAQEIADRSSLGFNRIAVNA